MISFDLKLVPSEDFINLLQRILMNQQEALDAIAAANTKLEAMSARMDKVMTEIATLLDAFTQAQGAMTPALQAAISALVQNVAAVETKVGQADDLQPDA
jgi:ABC-type transporter Mla subunit MlaD